jgi:hypothetical protein
MLTIKFVVEKIPLAIPRRMSHGDVSLQSARATIN